MYATEMGLVLPTMLALVAAASLAMNFTQVRALRRAREGLAAERKRTELVVRATQTGIFDWDVASNRIDYSERFKEILGFPLNADLSDRTRHFDSVHPEDRERAREAFVAHLREGRDKRDENLHPPIEYRMRRADGGYAWVRGTGLSLRGRDGRTTRYIASIIDISERKRQERELDIQTQRLGLVVRAARVGIIDSDQITRTAWYSERFKELLGFPADADTSGWTFFDRLHPEDSKNVYDALVKHLKGEDPSTRDSLILEYRTRRADDSYVWVQGMGLSLRDAAGRSTRFLAAITDISVRREQEQALREQIQLTQDIIGSNPNPIFIKDPACRFVEVNPAWVRHTGIPAKKAIGKTVSELFPTELSRSYDAQDRALLARGEGVNTVEIEVPRADGTLAQVIMSKSVLRRADGGVRGIVGTITDISQIKQAEEKLREQVELTRDLIRALPNPLFLKDEHFRFVHVNPAWEKMSGISAEKAVGGLVHEVYPPQFAEEFARQDAELVAEPSGTHSMEITIPGRKKTRHYILSKALLRREDGMLRGMVGSCTDITRIKEIEATLRDQMTLTRDLIDANPNPVYLKDEHCRFAEINAAYTQLTGLSREKCVGRTVLDLYPPDRAAVYDRQDRELLARGEGSSTIEVSEVAPISARTDAARPSGARQFLMSKSILKRADGRVRGLVGTLTDITDLKRAEQVVRENEERMRFWLENIPIPIAIYDPEGGVQYLNSSFVATFGWTLDEMRGKRMPFVPEHRREQLAGVLHNLLTVGKDAFETERMTRDGRLLDIYISTGMARAADGTPRATMVSLMDVTERKHMERELAASREEALQAAQAKAAFLAAMSHEIRTPLNGVLGMAGLLADTGLTEEQREYVDTIRVSGDALLSVINDVLDYSKIESGRMEVENEPFEPMRAVEEALEILGERARGKRLELAAEAEDSVPAWVRGDFARLRQVLVNLVGNAVKFTERGEVVVRVRAPRDGVLEIEASDTGIGIPKDRLAALFQPFAQADASTTRKYGGTGLGLAISKRLVELMGGELRADSEPGRGSTFVFSVSVRSCEAPSAVAIAAQPVELAGRRILIVDDNATNLRILRRQLERWGAVPVAASGGPAALALLEGKERFDAALLDYHMPGMDGVMLARRIKAQEKPMPLVLLSSSMYRRAEEAEAGLFVVQLLKPVRQQQLREALVTALGGAAPARKGSGSRATAGGQVQPQLRVLVVDDVDANCRLAQALLRKFGHTSEIATSGLEAVEMAIAGRYDVILMDVQMPDIDGMEATRRIHERLGAASPRIVAMTANALPGDRERCIAAGMDDYLSKPIQPQALRAAIEQAGGSAARPVARTARRTTASAPAGAIDWRRIESLAPFDPDGSMVAGAIASFLADAPGRIEAIRAAHAAADAAGLGAAAHALKGAAANIGAAGVEKLSHRIEALARKGDLAGARKAIAGLSKSLAQGGAALKAYARKVSRGS